MAMFMFLVLAVDGLEGVSGRNKGVSGSARRMNCNGVSGDPFDEGVDLTE